MTFLRSTITCLIVIAVLPCPQLASAGEGKITVDTEKPGVKVSPLLYGVFFEEINRAGDGGIYAEMVRNRSFDDADSPVAWALLKGNGADAEMSLDSSQPLNAKNPKSLKIQVASLGNSVAVSNEGFNGMSVQKGAKYNLSLYARCSKEFTGSLAVALEDKDRNKLASGSIKGIGAEWKKFECVLTAEGTSSAASLVIGLGSTGTLWLDVVSLFPQDTFKNRPNGLRKDLAEMLVGMKPAFVRFPGGCYVEGGVLADAFRWKDSIGDIAERPGHFNIWQHTRSNDGLGYHEYLLMSEDLGALPLFVINCGMAHGDHVPMDQMGPWVQDALDAIEYANGPVDGKWGALRAKAGHPKPFNLKYIEIGNENGGPLYQERYVLFYDAIKAKYPEMNLVADQMTEKRPTEINDEHYYSDPFFFIRSAGKYDSYDRKGPKIYVGEYAVTNGAGKGNLIAALGEAAFMTGMERNSDVVIMASYAPLFVNDGWRMWNPDAIVFNCAEVYGTPSYHVQAMFAKNRADVVLPVEVDSPPIEPEIPTGYIGVGSWRTQAEYKDIKVTEGDKVVFESDFTKGTDGWRTRGNWKVQDGSLRYEGRGEGERAIFTGGKWQDFTLTLKARKISGDEGFLIIFRAREEGTRSWWNIGGWGNSQHALELPFGGGGRRIPGRIETGRWYDIKIECKGPSIRCYLDGQLVEEMSTKNTGMKSLYAVAGKTDQSGDVILKVVNVSGQPCDTEIELRGIAKVDSKATASVLTSDSPEAENSFAEPTKVAQKEETLEGITPKFRRVFPALSVTVIKVRPTGK